MVEPSEEFWENAYRDLENPVYAQDFRDMVRSLSEGPMSSLLSDHFKSLADATGEELHAKLEAYREWLRQQSFVYHAAGGVVDVQHYGDYAETVAGGKPLDDDDPPLTFADLEGIGSPDLTTIVEDLKRATMPPVDRSIVDMVEDGIISRRESLRVEGDLHLSPVGDPRYLMNDYQVDEPVTATPLAEGPFVEDGPYQGYALSEANPLSTGSPRLRQPPPSPTAEAPGDVSLAHLDEIAELRKGEGIGSTFDFGDTETT